MTTITLVNIEIYSKETAIEEDFEIGLYRSRGKTNTGMYEIQP